MAEINPNRTGGFAGEQTGEGAQRVTSDTRWVLTTGGLVYVRIGEGSGTEILHASLIDIGPGEEPASSFGVRLELEKYSKQHKQAVVPGAKITIYILIKGVLYALPTQIDRSQADTTLRLAATVPDKCVGLSLRKNTRFDIMGIIRLYHPRIPEGFCQLFPIPMNISLGGFGMGAPDLELPVGDEARYILKIFVEKDGEADREAPSIEMTGMVKVCSRSQPKPGTRYYGFHFSQMAADDLAALASWLKANEAMLKET